MAATNPSNDEWLCYFNAPEVRQAIVMPTQSGRYLLPDQISGNQLVLDPKLGSILDKAVPRPSAKCHLVLSRPMLRLTYVSILGLYQSYESYVDARLVVRMGQLLGHSHVPLQVRGLRSFIRDPFIGLVPISLRREGPVKNRRYVLEIDQESEYSHGFGFFWFEPTP